MSFVKFNIHNRRQGVLTFKGDIVTCIHDDKIEGGDFLHHILYSKIVKDGVRTLSVEEVLEERPSKGNWGSESPATWRRLRCSVKTVPIKTMAEQKLVNVEVVKGDDGKPFEKVTIL